MLRRIFHSRQESPSTSSKRGRPQVVPSTANLRGPMPGQYFRRLGCRVLLIPLSVLVTSACKSPSEVFYEEPAGKLPIADIHIKNQFFGDDFLSLATYVPRGIHVVIFPNEDFPCCLVAPGEIVSRKDTLEEGDLKRI